MDLERVEKVIGLMKQYDLGELRVSDKDWEFSARRGDRPQAGSSIVLSAPLHSAASSAVAPAVTETHPPAAPPLAANLKEITAPIVGTFYRAPAPDQPPFKEVGDPVNPEDVV